MRRWLPTLVLMMISTEGLAEDHWFSVRGMNQKLELTGFLTSWSVQGKIQDPVITLPGGRILALVKPDIGVGLDLGMWTKNGEVLARGNLPISEEVVAAKVYDSRLLMATATKVFEVRVMDLKQTRSAAVDTKGPAPSFALLSPSGLWVVNNDSVSHFYIDGRPPLVRKRPLLGASQLPMCNEGGLVNGPCTGGLQPKETEAYVTDFGELFILESLVERYPYGNYPGFYDEVFPTFETVLAPDGKVVLQRAVSWVKKYREWFWRGPSSASPIPSPAEIGLVRARHRCDGLGFDGIFAVHGRDFFASHATSGGSLSFRRLNLKMEAVWTRDIDVWAPLVVSPSWAQPILIHDSHFGHFVTMNDRGRSINHRVIYPSEDCPDIDEDQARTNFKRPRFVIGQTPEGEWLLIGY